MVYNSGAVAKVEWGRNDLFSSLFQPAKRPISTSFLVLLVAGKTMATATVVKLT